MHGVPAERKTSSLRRGGRRAFSRRHQDGGLGPPGRRVNPVYSARIAVIGCTADARRAEGDAGEEPHEEGEAGR